MKRIVCLLLSVITAFSLVSCKTEKKPNKPNKPKAVINLTATDNDISALEAAYEGRTAFQGEMHDHSSMGDGKCSLVQWKNYMPLKKLDFAAILDHNGLYHMYSADWDDTLFIGGSEAACSSIDGTKLHYNMVFSEPEGLLKVLEMFPEFNYRGAPNGYFSWPTFTRERFCELSAAIRSFGGYLVFPHPTVSIACKPATDNPDCYYYGDYNGIEVIYVAAEHEATLNGYKLWKKLLKKGRRVYACSGGDGHGFPSNTALTTVYAEEKRANALLTHAREGDSTAGGAGIRMIINGTVSGGHLTFKKGDRLVIGIGDFHENAFFSNQEYRIKIYAGETEIADEPISIEKTNYFALDTDSSVPYYRAVVYQSSSIAKTVLAYGNPIWNDKH